MKMERLVVNGEAYQVHDPEAAHIDDAKVGKDSCWSSAQILQRLYPDFRETGAAVACMPVAGYPLDVVSQITPVQEGSGDPSPGGYVHYKTVSTTMEYGNGETSFGEDFDVGIYRVYDSANNKPPVVYDPGYNPDYTANGLYSEFEVIDSWVEVGFWIAPNEEAENDPVFVIERRMPGNIRPIRGHTGCKLWRNDEVFEVSFGQEASGGKNLLPCPYLSGSGVIGGLTSAIGQDGSVVFSGTPTGNADYDFVKGLSLPAGTYTFSVSGSFSTKGVPFVFVRSVEKGALATITLTSKKSGTFTLTEACDDITIYIYMDDTAYVTGTVYPQLEAGSAATAYVPYAGGSGSDRTVYGGSFNWATGELVIDRKMITLDGTEPWMIASTNTSDKYKYNINAKAVEKFSGIETAPGSGILDSKLMCSILPAMTGNSVHTCHEGISTNQYLLSAYGEQYSDGNLAGFKEMTKGAQIVFGLAEPVTIQLTPQEILALSGTNTLNSDTGATQVTGKQDLVLMLENIQKRLAAMETAAVNEAEVAENV